MRKLILTIAIFTILLQLVSAANLDVSVIDKEDVVIVESDEPAKFVLSITNNENVNDDFEIYSLVGVTILPKELFSINSGSTRELEIQAIPHEETKENIQGFFIFDYEIKGQNTGFYEDRLTIKIVNLEDSIEVSSGNVNLDNENIALTIENKEDFNFENLTISASSRFFDFSETFDLLPNEERVFEIPLNKEEIRGISAGQYEFETDIIFEDKEVSKQGMLNFLEKGEISIGESTQGFILRKTTILKTNEGNIDSTATIRETKDVLSRLFTTFSQQPLTSERRGLLMEYYWEKELSPGEEFRVSLTTNYTIPFIALILLIAAAFLARFFLTKSLSMQKSSSLVRTKGGEFALRVRLKVKARKPLNKVNIIDRLPGLVKLHEKFTVKPDKIDPRTRKLIWHINSLNSGEERVFTYVIYSKVKVVGKFELPSAMATFEKDGKLQEIYSNKTYFAAETSEDKE